MLQAYRQYDKNQVYTNGERGGIKLACIDQKNRGGPLFFSFFLWAIKKRVNGGSLEARKKKKRGDEGICKSPETREYSIYRGVQRRRRSFKRQKGK